jgi:hypothetical protein
MISDYMFYDNMLYDGILYDIMHYDIIQNDTISDDVMYGIRFRLKKLNQITFTGQNDGGLYAIRDPHTINALPIRITAVKKGWFYHRAVHVKLPTGEEGILTARAKKPLFGRGIGELVWLSMPPDLDSCFPATPPRDNNISDDPFFSDPVSTSSVRHTTMNQQAIDEAKRPKYPDIPKPISTTPWVETILAEGPDVMFEVLDLDPTDDSLEVISAHFFGQKLSVHSIKAIDQAPFIEISAMKTLDTIGRPYGLCLATMTPTPSRLNGEESSLQADYSSCDNSAPTHLLVSTHECSYDLPSAYNMALSAIGGIYPSIITGASFAVRNGRQSVRPGVEDGDVRGGSLFSYEIPRLAKSKRDIFSNVKSNELHSSISSDISVNELGNTDNLYSSIINKGKIEDTGLVSSTLDSSSIDGMTHSERATSSIAREKVVKIVENIEKKLWRDREGFIFDGGSR